MEDRYGCVVYYDEGMRVDVALPREPAKYVPKSKRGKVTEFSKRSRKRLFNKVGEIHKAEYENAYFLTLTYGESYPDTEQAKKDLRALYMRIVRKFGEKNVAILWRIELQKRGAPHFHCILFLRVKVYDIELVRVLSKMWYEIAGNNDVKHLMFAQGRLRGSVQFVSRIKSLRNVVSYVAKYCCKVNQQVMQGRHWGILGEKILEKARKIRIPLSVCEVQKLMRLMKRYCHIPNKVRLRVLNVLMINNKIVYDRLDELVCY